MEKGRLESFLKSAETLKVHGLCDQNQSNNEEIDEKPPKAKKVKRNKSVTSTISPYLRPSSRNSPKPGPSKVSNTPPPPVSVKVENYESDEENQPEHVVIPSDPNSIGKVSTFLDHFGPNIWIYLFQKLLEIRIEDKMSLIQ